MTNQKTNNNAGGKISLMNQMMASKIVNKKHKFPPRLFIVIKWHKNLECEDRARLLEEETRKFNNWKLKTQKKPLMREITNASLGPKNPLFSSFSLAQALYMRIMTTKGK